MRRDWPQARVINRRPSAPMLSGLGLQLSFTVGAAMGLQDIHPIVDTAEGRAYFPYNRWARGYLLAPGDEVQLKRFLGRLRWCGLALVPLMIAVFPWPHGYQLLGVVAYAIGYAGLYYTIVAIRCRNLPRARERMPRLHATRRAATALSNGFIVYGLVFCLAVAVGGVVMFRKGIGEPAMAAATIIFFTGLWLRYCRIAWMKWCRPRPDGRDTAR